MTHPLYTAVQNGSFQLYEDDNESNAYLKDECVLIRYGSEVAAFGRFVIHKAAGRLELIPQKRTWTVEFWGVKDTEVTVEVEGTGAEASKEYDEALGLPGGKCSGNLCNL